MLKIKYYLQRPEDGFDPVPLPYAKSYAEAEYNKFNPDLVEELENRIGNIAKKTLIDLGAGPGQYSIEFAKRAAKVTWHDISKNYLKIAEQHAQSNNLNINFSLGYLEEAKGCYDILFNRICWYYCIDDYKFASLIYTLVNKGGYAFILVNNNDFLFNQIKNYSFIKRNVIKVFYAINEKLNIKLIHVHPSHNKLRRVFSEYKFERFDIEKLGNNTLIFFKKYS